MEALIGKVSFIGLRCRGGFIRGVRGTIVGRELEDVKDRIENDFESWEIALIVSGSCGFAVIVALIGYGVAMYKMNYANDGEEYEMEGRVVTACYFIYSFLNVLSKLLQNNIQNNLQRILQSNHKVFFFVMFLCSILEQRLTKISKKNCIL